VADISVLVEMGSLLNELHTLQLDFARPTAASGNARDTVSVNTNSTGLAEADGVYGLASSLATSSVM